MLSLVRISVLLALPHEGALLGSNLEYGRVQRLNNRVGDLSVLVDHVLGLSREVVIEFVACLEVGCSRGSLFHNCTRGPITHIS